MSLILFQKEDLWELLHKKVKFNLLIHRKSLWESMNNAVIDLLRERIMGGTTRCVSPIQVLS